MINASGASGVPLTPAQPTGTPQVAATQPAAPTLPPAMPAAPSAPASTPAVAPASPVGGPATTPATPANTVAGAGSGNKLKPPGKKLPIKLIIGGVVLLLLLVGGIAAYLLSQTSQDVRQQASEPTYNDLCIQQYGGNPMLMSQAVSSCESNSAKNWDPVKCECVDAPPTTGTTSRICGPNHPKWDASKRQCKKILK
jgi:hypothetical protein